MSDLEKYSPSTVNDVLGSFIRFINDSHTMRMALNGLKEIRDKNTQNKQVSINRVDWWIWMAFANWTKHYTQSWVGIGKISPILKERWGSCQWADECRGDLYSLIMPFFFDPNWPEEAHAAKEKAFAALDDLTKQQSENDRIYSEDYHAAMERASNSGLGAVNDEKWIQQEQRFTETNESIWKSAEKVADEMRDNPLSLRIIGYAMDPMRPKEFDRRLINIELRTATLVAVAADNEPPVAREGKQIKQFDPLVLGVLRRLAESKTSMTIEDIAGIPGCPKSEKTVGKIIKGLIAEGLVSRLRRGGGATITQAGRDSI
jgi:hypothetical protein